MTTAQELSKMNYTDAITEAAKIAVETEEDYGNETTIFFFRDGSKLQASSIDYSLKEI